MSEAAINRRKSQLFLTQISPVYDTHDEVVRKKLKKGKFPQTKTGIIKMVSLCLYVGSVISWSLIKEQCDSLSILYSNIASIGLGLMGGLLLFFLFSFGMTINNPGKWIHSDIAFNLSVSLAVILTSVLSLKSCKAVEMKHLTAALAISAACSSICSCAAIFLMYRFIEDTDEEMQQGAKKPVRRDPRKSIFA